MNVSSGPGTRFLWCLLPFLLLATLNSAGYRYGASDQAFYAPAMLEGIDPSLFPRDSDLIRSQARLTLVDNVIGPVARTIGIALPPAFVALQVLTLLLLASAVFAIGLRLYRTGWAAIALVAAVSLRHAISKSGTNTLEGYFHPRQLSFAIGALAIAGFLRGRYTVTVGAPRGRRRTASDDGPLDCDLAWRRDLRRGAAAATPARGLRRASARSPPPGPCRQVRSRDG